MPDTFTPVSGTNVNAPPIGYRGSQVGQDSKFNALADQKLFDTWKKLTGASFTARPTDPKFLAWKASNAPAKMQAPPANPMTPPLTTLAGGAAGGSLP